MSKASLDRLAAEVADQQKKLDGAGKDVRTRVIGMGKRLTQMQKVQKTEQAETGQTWKEWCEEQKVGLAYFPHYGDCAKYALIARYPGAYKEGMSIKEAYKEAGQWKKNGGNPPLKKKLTIKSRPLITVQVVASRLSRKLDKLSDIDSISEEATANKWSEDEILGATDELTLLRQGCNAALRTLRALHDRVH